MAPQAFHALTSNLSLRYQINVLLADREFVFESVQFTRRLDPSA
jgi:hypothetical protein